MKTNVNRTNSGRIFVLVIFFALFVSPIRSRVMAQSGLNASFDYSVPKRFGLDANKDGKIDYFTTQAEINPGKWHANFNACSSTGSPTMYRWHINSEFAGEFDTCDAFSYDFEEEGTYMVTLAVNDPEGNSAATIQYVWIQDWLIIGLGDSYGSGEGNPDIPLSPKNTKAIWQDDGCNRSAFSGQAQAAKRLEDADPHTSVTFVHLACSGNVIAHLTQNGGQLEDAKSLAGNRMVDAIVISIGGNDINFSGIVKACMYQAECDKSSRVDPFPLATIACGKLKDNKSFEDYLECLDFIDVVPEKSANDIYEAGLQILDASYQDLNVAIHESLGASFPSDRVFITEYPDLARNDFGHICGEKIFEPQGPPLPGWSPGEGKWASDTVLPGLNGKIKNAATRYSWSYVTNIATLFQNHGYCAVINSEGNPTRWIVTLEESFVVQGDQYGVVHPNKLGHQTYANQIFLSLLSKLYVDGKLSRPKQIPSALLFGPYQINEGENLLLNSMPLNLNGDQLAYNWSLDVSPEQTTLSFPHVEQPTLLAHDSVSNGKLSLTVTNSSGSYSTSTQFTVKNMPPKADAGQDQTVNEGTTVNLEGAYTDPGKFDTHTFDWSLVNSTNGQTFPGSHQDQTFNFTPSDNGEYTFQFSVSDDDSAKGSDEVKVTVSNVAPTASLSSNSPIDEGSSATIRFTDADDPSSADRQAGFHYAFDCTGGSLNTASYANSRTSDSIECTYPDDGSYTVRGKIIDKDGGANEYTTVVTVNNIDPTGTLSSNSPILEGDSAAIIFTDIQDRSATDIQAGLRFAFDCNGNSLEAVTYDNSGSSNSTDCPFNDNNSFTVSGKVMDKDGGATEITTTVIVTNVAPSALPAVDGDPFEGSPVHLTGGFDDPGADEHTFVWRFLNSSNGQTIPDATSQDYNFTPVDNGTYSFELEVTDDDDASGSDILSIDVGNVEPIVAANDTSINENDFATLFFTIQDPGIQDDFKLEIDWGDEERALVDLPAGTEDYSISHRYLDDQPSGTNSDDYHVQISLKDKDQGEGQAQPTVTVININPAVQINQLADESGRVLEPADVIPAGISITSEENYSDTGELDTRTAVRDWGDGTIDDLETVLELTTGSHAFSQPGDYRLVITVTDDDTGLATMERTIRVVSPAGAIERVIRELSASQSTDRRANVSIQAARDALDGESGALITIQRGNPYGSVRAISKAVVELTSAENKDPQLDFTPQKIQLALAAQSILIEAIPRAQANAGNRNQQDKVAEAVLLFDSGKAHLSLGNTLSAVSRFRRAMNRIR